MRWAIKTTKVRTKLTVRRIEGGTELETIRTVEYRLWDKVAALDKLAKHLGMYLDQGQLDAAHAKADAIKTRLDSALKP
jgi:hypothetical protein